MGESNNIPKNPNKILLHAVPHRWAKQAMMFMFNFESESFYDAIELFECMEVANTIYKSA